MKRCPVCSSPRASSHYSLYDDRYGYVGRYVILRCHSCRHKWLDASFTEAELADLYTNYYPRSDFKVEDYRPATEASGFFAWLDGEMRSAFRWVPRNVRVLDIGCGFGETLGYHEARGCEAHGVEADANIRRVADRYGFKAKVGLFDPDAYEPAYFDFVTMDQVIEHSADPVKMLSGVAKVLKPGGTAILSTPNSNGLCASVFGRRWINWHVPYHLQHFSKRSMSIAAREAGLALESASTITSSEWLYYQWLHIFVYPYMGSPAAFWSRTGKCGIPGKIALRLFPLLRKLKLNHVVTRILDATGAGDNYLFFLRKA